jgi:hypothetical protein
MKLKPLIYSLSPLFIFSIAYADATPSIEILQNQINALQSQINALQTENTASSMIMSDASNPFSAMSDTLFPLGVMQAKPSFTAPLILGGELEMDIQTWGGSFSTRIDRTTTYQDGSDIAVPTADLNALANLGTWVSVYLSIEGGAAPATTSIGQAFMLFGNLQNNPFFLTAGQTYLPFGVFNGNGPYANNLDTNAFRASNTNQVTLNYSQGNFYTNLAGLENKDDRSNLDDFSYTISYTTSGNFNYSVGAGYLYDVRGLGSEVGESYPNNNANEGDPNPTNPGNTIRGDRNAVYDLNALVAYGVYGLNAEANLTQTGAESLNGQATGQMSAWNLAGTYSPTLWNIPTTFTLSYSATHNMQDISFPLNGMANNPQETQMGDHDSGMAHQWLIAMSNEFVTNVYMSPEFAYATLYNGTNTWSLTYDITANL